MMMMIPKESRLSFYIAVWITLVVASVVFWYNTPSVKEHRTGISTGLKCDRSGVVEAHWIKWEVGKVYINDGKAQIEITTLGVTYMFFSSTEELMTWGWHSKVYTTNLINMDSSGCVLQVRMYPAKRTVTLFKVSDEEIPSCDMKTDNRLL